MAPAVAPCTVRAIASSEHVGNRLRAISAESCPRRSRVAAGGAPCWSTAAEEPHVKATGLEECHGQTFPEAGRGEALRPGGQRLYGDREVRNADRWPVAVDAGKLDLLRH